MGVVFAVCFRKQAHLLRTGAMHEQPEIGRERIRNDGVLELLHVNEMALLHLCYNQLSHGHSLPLLQLKTLPSNDHQQSVNQQVVHGFIRNT